MAAAAAAVVAEDPWVARTLATVPAGQAAGGLSGLRASCSQALLTLRMPTTRNEEYRCAAARCLLRDSVGFTNLCMKFHQLMHDILRVSV